MKLKKNYVFTYGTLMKGERSHYYLNDVDYVCDATINGFRMFDLKSYPGIEHGDGIVVGELYLVDDKTLASIDRLEGEGYLYIRKQVTVKTINKEYEAYVYVYNQEVNKPLYLGNGMYSWKNLNEKYVWYVSYGSNLCLERFLLYIVGGTNKELNVSQIGCKDKSLPLMSRMVNIPYKLYFARSSSRWNNGGVAFIDETTQSNTIGRAYLITKEQLIDVQTQEGATWYDNKLYLGQIDGIVAYTLTSSRKETVNCVDQLYEKVVLRGLMELELDKIEAIKYLKSHM